jgi:hypothetical protein
MKAAFFGVRDHRMVISRRQATARTADKLAILRRHSLFGQLSQAAMEHLGSYMKRRSLPRGTVIFAKGDPGTGLMGVQWKAAAFVRWHAPDDARVSSPDL